MILGSFDVNIESPCEIKLESLNLLNTYRIGRTVFDYEYSATISNNCQTDLSNLRLNVLDLPENITVQENTINLSSLDSGQSMIANGRLVLRIDQSEQTDINLLNMEIVTYVSGDITGDGLVNIDDLTVLVSQWLQSPGIPSADIAPEPPDNVVDMLDFAELAENLMN